MEKLNIETERLIITEFTAEMAQEVHENSLDEDNRRFVPDEVFETAKEAEETIRFLRAQYGGTEGPQAYAVLTKDGGKNIGYVQMVPIDGGRWEIGYHIAQKYTGRGYAAEAVSAFLPVMAKRIGIDEVYDAADLETAAEAEAETLLTEQLAKGRGAILTNSFAAKAFLEQDFPERKESFVFYGATLARFGAALGGKADKLFAFTPVGNDAAETEKTHPVDIAVNPRELARIMIRTGSEPNPKRTAALKPLSVPQPSGKYGRLLEKAAWSMGRDAAPEHFTVGELKCVICHNLGQARAVLESGERFDAVRVIG